MIRVKKCETTGFEQGKSCPGFLYVTLHCWPWGHPCCVLRRITDYRLTAQITGSPPLLSDLDNLCEMEHEGQSFFWWKPYEIIKSTRRPKTISTTYRLKASSGRECLLYLTKPSGETLSKFSLGLLVFVNKMADRRGAPPASYDRRRHRNNFQSRPAQAFPKKVSLSWGQRSVDAIKRFLATLDLHLLRSTCTSENIDLRA